MILYIQNIVKVLKNIIIKSIDYLMNVNQTSVKFLFIYLTDCFARLFNLLGILVIGAPPLLVGGVAY